MSDLPPEMLDADTPADVVVTDMPPPRITDPTLGVALGEPSAACRPCPPIRPTRSSPSATRSPTA